MSQGAASIGGLVGFFSVPAAAGAAVAEAVRLNAASASLSADGPSRRASGETRHCAGVNEQLCAEQRPTAPQFNCKPPDLYLDQA